MAVSTAAMFARQRFGDALKRARLAARTNSGARIKQSDVAAAFGRRSIDRVSRLERGLAWPEAEEWRTLLHVLNVDAETRARLSAMRDQGMSIAEAWWTDFDGEFPDSLIQFVAYEDAARTISTCSGQTLPGLLQTAEYAHALTRTQAGSVFTEHAVERSVELRARRRSILDKDPRPTVEALFSEGALWQRVGGADVMVRQIDSLLADASERDVVMRVVPYTASAPPVYMFHLLTFGEDEKPIAAVDSMTGMTFRKAPREAREVREFRQSFDRLRRSALSPEESLDKMTAIRKELSRG
ncbi:helix-turn-helix transcriptional regulator [Streptomyces sp. NPDC095613]|uniref:helix-turn-helix domain-containing protein n=1 Tax=Streptomyces sp. NPDC095613 TaxID=3155540 RepID=UPI003321F5C1